MNFVPSWLIVYSPAVLVGSLVLSVLLETLVWAIVLRIRLGVTSFVTICGWMTLVQGVSTPLSFAISLLLYTPGLELVAFHPTLLALLLQVQGPVSNPVGSVVGFLLTPILLEYGLWYDARKWAIHRKDELTTQHARTLSKGTLASGAIAANLTSFSVGILLAVLADDLYWVIAYLALYSVILLLIAVVKTIDRYKYHKATSNPGLARSSSTFDAPLDKRDSSRIARSTVRSQKKGHLGLLTVVGILIFVAVVTLPVVFNSPFRVPGSSPTYVNRSDVRGVLAKDGTLYVGWFRRSEGFSSTTDVLVCRRLSGGRWFDPEVVADGDYARLWFNKPSLACNGSSQLAVGWIAAGAFPWNESFAYYRLLDGATWQDIQMLPGMNCRSIDVAYDANGRLHLLWTNVNASAPTTTWELYHWEVDSGSPPALLASLDDHYWHIGGCRLVHDGQNRLYAVWTQFSGYTISPASEAICTRIFANGSWLGASTLLNSSHSFFDWDAVAGTNGVIHIAWSMYENHIGTAIYHTSGANATWETPVLLGQGTFSPLLIAAEEGGTVLVAWSSSSANSWSYRELVNDEWRAVTVLSLPPGDPYALSSLLLPSSSEFYAIRSETLATVSQLVFYALNHNGIVSVFVIDPIDPGAILQLQVTTFYQGASLLIGVMVLSPILVHLLRRLFISVLASASRC